MPLKADRDATSSSRRSSVCLGFQRTDKAEAFGVAQAVDTGRVCRWRDHTHTAHTGWSTSTQVNLI